MTDIEDLLRRHGSAIDRLGDAKGMSDVFSREFGAELTSWELALQRKFMERQSYRVYTCRGFVHHTTDTTLVLVTPSPWMLEGTFVYIRPDQDLPPDGALVEVTGKNILAPRQLVRSKKEIRAITADEIEVLPVELLTDITPPLSLKEMSRMLFEHVGMAEASKRVFSQLFVSSPPYLGSIGGLTAGVQAIASKRQIQRFLSFTKDIVPPSLRGRWAKTRRVRDVTVRTPPVWRLEVGKFGKPKLEELCVERRDPSGYREVSIGTMTDKRTAMLPDVPLALADEDFWIERRSAKELRLPILKASLTFQLMTPQVADRSVKAGTKHVISRLDMLKDSFGLEDTSLARGHLLDADLQGRPLSAIKIARSAARARWKDKITAKDIKRSWDKVLEPALKEFIELTRFKADVQEDYGQDARIHQFNTKVWRALKRLDSGKSSSLGPTLDEIASEAGVEKHVAAAALTEMKDSGVVFEPRTGHYRLV